MSYLLGSVGLFGSIFYKRWLHAQALELWSDKAMLASWIEIEIALARAQADCGLIPMQASEKMAATVSVDALDIGMLEQGMAKTMHPFVPLLHQLEKLCGDEAASYLHWGATTQNIFDTAQALRLKRTHALALPIIATAIEQAKYLALEYRDTPQAGRTHGQHALPITFGFKVAAWRSELRRMRDRLEAAAQTAFMVSMGGAVGTYSAMGGKGREVQQRLAAQLGLVSHDVPVRSASDGPMHYMAVWAMLATTVEKIAEEFIFLQRTEIAEAGEKFHDGKIGSSTMAQKRNPQQAQDLSVLARSVRTRMSQVQDAAIRSNEGDSTACSLADLAVAEMAVLGVSMLDRLASLLKAASVDAAAMRRNLDISGGLILSEAVMMALAQKIGRHEAHRVLYEVAQAVQDGAGGFAHLLSAHPSVKEVLSVAEISAMLRPDNYLGEAASCVDEEIKRS
jgi:adenylosuccinate lyase